MGWSCSACTFLNERSDDLACECCGTAREAAARKRTRAQQCVEVDEEDDVIWVGENDVIAGPQAADAEHYVLDCGCRALGQDELAQELWEQAQQQLLLPHTSLIQATGCLSCSQCTKLVSSADLYKLLGAARLSQLYMALVTKVQAEHANQHPATSPCCPDCDGSQPVLPASDLSSSDSRDLPDLDVLQEALLVRQHNPPRSAGGCAAQLAAYLGSACAYFCTSCDRQWPPRSMSAAAVAAPGEAASAAAVTAAHQAVQLWQQLAQLQGLMVAPSGAATGAGAAGAGAGAGAADAKGSRKERQRRGSTPSKRCSTGGSSKQQHWAAGTGYGGGDADAKATQAIRAAAERQKENDAQLHCCLESIVALASGRRATATRVQQGPSSSSKKRRKAAANGEDAAELDVPAQPAAAAAAAAAAATPAGCVLGVPGVAVLLGGPLVWLLRLLFSNDSMLDIGGRQELYRSAMNLMSFISISPDLLPMLELPADDPRDSSSSSSSAPPVTLLSVLQRLQQQAQLYNKSAAELLQEEADNDTLAAACMALDYSSMYQSLCEASHLFNTTLAAAKGRLELRPCCAGPAPAPPTSGTTEPPAAAAAAAGPSQRHTRQKATAGTPRGLGSNVAAGHAATGTAAAAAASAAAALDVQYKTALQPHQFVEADLMAGGHYFKKEAIQLATQASGGEVMRRRLRRITEELGSLATGLPLSYDSSVLLAVDRERLDVLRALLLPHHDTPYGSGAFVFDILLPAQYPDKPPLVHFLTTGGGRVRFNPNLYESGKVCLSLLGTWTGPSWQPNESTLLQVLVSLQSMVFVPDPFFNEPGYEANRSRYEQRAQAYNNNLRVETARVAILGALQKPDPAFKEGLALHFSIKGPAIVELLEQWARDTGGRERDSLRDIVRQVKVDLARLPAPAAQAPIGTAAAADAAVTAAEATPVQLGQGSSHQAAAEAAADPMVPQHTSSDIVIDLT